MSFDVSYLSFGDNRNPGEQKQPTATTGGRDSVVLLVLFVMFQLTGYVSDKVDEQSGLTSYQQTLADQGPQERADTRGRNPHQPLDLLKPAPSPTGAIIEDRASPESLDESEPVSFPAEAAPNVAAVMDPSTGQRTVLGSGLTQAKRLEPIPSPVEGMSDVEIVADPNTGTKIVSITIEQAVARTLTNSPEIRVVSFDPSIAKQDITKAASEF